MLRYTVFIAIVCFSTYLVHGQSAAELYAQADVAYHAEEFKKAGDLFAKAYEADPDWQNAKYASFNAGCAYSLAKDKKNANKYAAISFDKGMLAFEEDKDFDNVRKSCKFKKLQKKASAELEQLKSVASNMPITYLPSGHNKDEAAPLIVLLHGYGGNPAKFIEAYKALADSKNAVLMACRGSEVSGRDSYYWDYESEAAKNKIRKDIESVVKRLNINKDKILLSGFSQGGYLCFDFGLKNADLFKGIMPVAGALPSAIELSKLSNPDLKLYAFIGLKESKNFLEAYENLDVRLDELKIPYHLKYSNVGHSYPENKDAELMQAYDWLME